MRKGEFEMAVAQENRIRKRIIEEGQRKGNTMKENAQKKPTLSEVRRAAAMRSVEVRRRMNPKVETTSITCERADSKRVRAISDAENITMKAAVTLCVNAYEDAQRDK